MAKSISLIQKHYNRILTQWPHDILRPEISFQDAMRRRIERRFSPQEQRQQKEALSVKDSSSLSTSLSSSATATLTPTTETGTGTGKGTTTPTNEEASELELEQINVLYSLLENRYMKKYPLTETIMKPLSNPTYYEDLRTEMDEAPRRGKWEAFFKRWKGFLRFT